MDPDGATEIMQLLNDYSAPYVADSVYQEVVRSLQFKRTTQTLDDFLVRSDLLRRKAGPAMQMGGAFPETSVSVLLMQMIPPPGLIDH